VTRGGTAAPPPPIIKGADILLPLEPVGADGVKRVRQNYLSDEHIQKIVDTYQQRPDSIEQYARCVGMDEIEANDFNLNISRYVSTAKQAVAIDLSATHRELVEIEKQIQESTAKYNVFLKELGLSPLPAPGK
jgi:type I restriction enzyme M protein